MTTPLAFGQWREDSAHVFSLFCGSISCSVRPGFVKKKKKLRQQGLNYYFSKWVERQWLLLPKLLWTIGFWHGDWNLNSMKKSRKLSRPHYLMLSRLQSKKWVMSLHLCKQNSAPRPERDTDCPSACLYSPEMVTGQTAHFPWNWTKLGCAEWVRGAVLSDERKGKISHGKGPWDQSRGPASQAQIDRSRQLASHKGFISTTSHILVFHSTHPAAQAELDLCPPGQDILSYSDEWIK